MYGMTQKTLKVALATVVFLLAQAASAMSLDEWGTSAGSSTLACASFSWPNCGVGTSPLDSGPDADNLMMTAADSSVVSARGSAEGHARLSTLSGISTPELKAYAAGAAGTSLTAGIGQGYAGAIEGYTYSGPATSINLDIELTGTIFNPNDRGFTSIQARVYILDPTDFEDGGFGTVNLQGFLGEGVSPLDSINLFLDASGSDIGSLFLDLNDGDQFYLYATLSASAANGAVSDALGTLDMSFSSNVGLVAASAVPLPAALWLLGSAAVGLIGAGRRRRTA